MGWEIEGGNERLDPVGYDGWVWRWRLRHDLDPKRRESIIVRISGTAMSMADEVLPPRVAVARETEGRSEIEQVLGWPIPPDEIRVDSQRVVPSGGDPGPEGRELIEILQWFEGRGMLVIFAARRQLSGDGVTVVGETHSAHVVARDEDKYFNHFEALSRLDAARKAKAHWEEVGEEAQVDAAPVSARAEAPVPRVEKTERVEALREQGYRLVWIEPVDPDDPIWALQVFTDEGELLVIGLGDNVEDALLSVAEDLLPER